MRDRIVQFIGTTAWTGLAPVAPATVSTVAIALPLLLFGVSLITLWVLFVVVLLLSVPVASRMERLYGKDPGCCTIDEAVGFLLPLALMGRDLTGLADWRLILAALVLFRLFDIAKPWPCRAAERLPAGWGIVADDLVAGLQTAAVLFLLQHLGWIAPEVLR